MNRALLCCCVVAVLLPACAVRLGGPKPEEFRTVALVADEAASAASVAARIRSADADAVLVEAPGDSAWFAELARAAELKLSGPGRTATMALAFLTRSEALGDTTITLPLPAGAGLVVHDALYRVDKSRYLDLLLLRVEPGMDARAATRALLAYVATDVLPNAAVILAVDAVRPASGDTLSALLQPAFLDVRGCGREGAAAPAFGAARMRLFFGPELRVRCDEARVLDGTGTAVFARLLVER